MSTGEIVTLIAAALVSAPVASLIAQLIRRASWPPWAAFAVVTVVCYAAGVATTWIAGDLLGIIDAWGELTAAQVIAYCAAVHVTAVIWYESYFKGLPFFGTLLRL